MLSKCAMILFAVAGLVPVANAQPTISGTSAFWWLGSGISSDNGYYAYTTLTANPNGLSGTATWRVSTVPGGGSVTIACNPSPADCTQATATATVPSNGCTHDVSVYVTIGGVESVSAFAIAIIQPKYLTLRSGPGITNPADNSLGIGFQTVYQWNVTDTCLSLDIGLDQNETFGSFTQVTTNNWNTPSASGATQSGSIFYDYMSAVCDCDTPLPENPSGGSTIMFYAPWSTYAGSTTPGSGVPMYLFEVSGYSEYFVLYEDHGRHCSSGSGCS